MKRNARRILTLILAMAMALGMLAGCGGDDSSTPSNGNDAQGGTTAPSTPAAPDSGSAWKETASPLEPDLQKLLRPLSLGPWRSRGSIPRPHSGTGQKIFPSRR